MNGINMIGSILLFFGLKTILVTGSNPFEKFPIRPKCFKMREMKDCQEKFTSLYKNVSRSYRNGSEADSAFFLFTRQNPDHPEGLQQCGGQLPSNTFFNPDDGVEVVVHGANDGVCGTTWMREIKDELLKRGSYNAILVDWTWGNSIDYADALHNLRIAASQVAIVIRNIMSQTGIEGKKFHVIGHSLGGHLAGFIGQEVKLGRITALEPAGPGFSGKSKDERLDPSDADIVDCIHTNAGLCLPQFGDITPICDSDFYVNGGVEQVSCIPHAIISFLKGDFLIAFGSFSLDACSHFHVVQYFKASINPDEQFVGVMCKNYDDFRTGKCNSCGRHGRRCAVMGMDYAKYLGKRRKGTSIKYYLDTALMCPYVDNKKINLQGYETVLRRKA